MAEERKTTYKTRLVKERVDEETGEIIRQAVETEYVPGFVDVKLPKRKHLGNGDFITVFQNTMFRIATEAKLSKNEMQILLYLLGTAGFDNSIYIDLDILSEDLDIKKPNVSTALKGLLKRNIIIKRDGYRGGNQKTKPFELSINYDQLNYGITWKGDYNEHKKVKMNHPEILSLPKEEPKQLDLFDLIEEAEKEDKE
jgi:putative plasmid replication protein